MKTRPVLSDTTQLSSDARSTRRAYFAPMRTMKYLRHLQWPQLLAIALGLGSVILWISMSKLDALNADISSQTKKLHRQNTIATPTGSPIQNRLPLAPPEEQFFADLKVLFKIAKSKGVSLGPVDYKREPRAKTSIVSRQIELHLTNDYSRMKEFIATILAEFPHAALQELRIERRDALSPQALILVKFSLIYESIDSATVRRP